MRTLLPLLAWLSVCPALAAAQPRPNIILVMVDDMGWSDLGCYGGEIHTPHIDSLAENGLRFSAFYNTGRCCPTRASLLTGLYPHQAGVGRMTFDNNQPGYRGRLLDNAVTIAEVLRAAGYRTGMVGKWHLSLTTQGDEHMAFLNNQKILDRFSDLDSYPVSRGFETHYGIIWGVINYFDPFSLVRDRTPIRQVPDDYYITDAFTDEAIKQIEDFAAGDGPFFLYLAHTAPHWPLHALPEDIEKYQSTYQDGWRKIRQARYRRQVEMRLLQQDTAPLSTRFDPDADWQRNPTAAWDTRAMAVHAAMVDRVDQGMGRIVKKLVEADELDNTVILVLSDNGASRETPRRPGFDRVSQTRDGQEVIYFGDRDASKSMMPGPETTYAGFGPRWANVANTPFRLFKATQHEGGIRTPLVVHWPNGIAAKGEISGQVGHVIDIMATCCDLAETPYPTEFGGNEITPLEGKSLVPIFQGRQREGHDRVCFEHYGSRAIRRRDWKLVAQPNKAWELYHLVEDQTETRDLAADKPALRDELADEWQSWAERARVVPRPGRN